MQAEAEPANHFDEDVPVEIATFRATLKGAWNKTSTIRTKTARVIA